MILESEVGNIFVEKLITLQYEPYLKFALNPNTNQPVVRHYYNQWLFVCYESTDPLDNEYRIYVYNIEMSKHNSLYTVIMIPKINQANPNLLVTSMMY